MNCENRQTCRVGPDSAKVPRIQIAPNIDFVRKLDFLCWINFKPAIFVKSTACKSYILDNNIEGHCSKRLF